MRIAIIGWGSLIWGPRQLPFEGNGEWQINGPKLPIEFSRVSKDGRLTLVIVDPKNGDGVPTRYVQSTRTELGDAIADLRDREGTILKRIGFVDLTSKTNSKLKYNDQIDIFPIIEAWCKDKGYDAAVWTALPAQFKEETNKCFSVDNAVMYLKGLPKTVRKNALDYIEKAPVEVSTPLRKKLKEIGLYR